MEKRYDFRKIESKWRARWEADPINRGGEGKPKFYCLDMFPYPSSAGLHVGHWRGYVLSDAIARLKVIQGYHALHPMGWDAFGLPAENYAIKMGIHPADSTRDSVANFKRQLKEISAIYDWSREINTTDPEYYKWTQWIFTRMFERGLAYEKEMPLNWCPSCKVVLSNEEAADGECDRCGHTVTKKNLRQWMLRITAYAERLLADLDKLDWPEKVKKMQSDWIGRSYGAEVDFGVKDSDRKIRVYTTRPDTLHGATFMVLAPEYAGLDAIVTPDRAEAVTAYRREASVKSSVDRMAGKEKTGVFTGAYAVNPMNGAYLPVWVSDYVLADYGTGAIMCVPAHDQRDFEFADKFGLPVVQVIIKEGESPSILAGAYESEGIMINSGELNGARSSEAKDKAAQWLESRGLGKKTVNYKLRDWVFSRQRYWGEPIPLIRCPKCGVVAVPDKDLPVRLPDVETYQPTDTGESPLSAITDWVNTVCPKCGGAAKRETNTMPQWAGSSWYFLRYADPDNADAPASPEALKKWLPVDYYVGGVEHAVLHLLYARFYTKFLHDIGVVDFDEPFVKLFNQGMVTRGGAKMSKNKGNGVSPDEIVAKYGCDSLRMYELFMGPPELDSEWTDTGIEGVCRFLGRVYALVERCAGHPAPDSRELSRARSKMIRDITQRFDSLSLNTVVSGFMEYTNQFYDLERRGGIDRETLESLVILLAPFVPHLAEELWEGLGHKTSVFAAKYPEWDAEAAKDDEKTIAVQLNGKTRGTVSVAAGADKEAVFAAAAAMLGGRLDPAAAKRVIHVPDKLINIVV
ncbi:MAG: leucine--tRNA ligase [Clostridiales bacterium]|nr:leucine--tRNA ligase [Clostridiales bacterium]